MIHSVYFWLKADLSDADRARFVEEAKKLLTIDAVARGAVNKPAPTTERPVTDHSFDYCLVFEFDSIAKQDEYQVHPDHDVFVANCKDLWDRVVVYDSEAV